MVKLIVGVPTYEGHKHYVPQLLESLKKQTVPHEVFFCNTGTDQAFQDYLLATGHTVLNIHPTDDRAERITNGRNAIRNAFLKTDATHLVWVDTDMTLAHDAFERLLSDNKDIVSGAYLSPFPFEGKTVIGVVAYSFIPDKKLGQFVPFNALFTKAVLRVKAVGFGICLVSRGVMAKVPIRQKDEFNGEDFLFCMDADKSGYDVYLDTRVWARHHAWPPGDERNNMLDIELQGRRAGFLR